MKQIYLLENSRIVSELLRFDLTKEFNCEVTILENGNDLIDNMSSNQKKVC